MTRKRRPVSVILAAAVFCFGVLFVVSYLHFVSPEDFGSIVHTRILWGGIMCLFVGTVWAYSSLFGKE